MADRGRRQGRPAGFRVLDDTMDPSSKTVDTSAGGPSPERSVPDARRSNTGDEHTLSISASWQRRSAKEDL